MSNANSQNTVDEFLSKFLDAPKGKSPEAMQSRLIYWIERCNHAEKYTNGDPSKFAIADVRRKARQNVRRIVTAHPDVAAQVAAQLEKPEAA